MGRVCRARRSSPRFRVYGLRSRRAGDVSGLAGPADDGPLGHSRIRRRLKDSGGQGEGLQHGVSRARRADQDLHEPSARRARPAVAAATTRRDWPLASTALTRSRPVFGAAGNFRHSDATGAIVPRWREHEVQAHRGGFGDRLRVSAERRGGRAAEGSGRAHRQRAGRRRQGFHRHLRHLLRLHPARGRDQPGAAGRSGRARSAPPRRMARRAGQGVRQPLLHRPERVLGAGPSPRRTASS